MSVYFHAPSYYPLTSTGDGRSVCDVACSCKDFDARGTGTTEANARLAAERLWQRHHERIGAAAAAETEAAPLAAAGDLGPASRWLRGHRVTLAATAAGFILGGFVVAGIAGASGSSPSEPARVAGDTEYEPSATDPSTESQSSSSSATSRTSPKREPSRRPVAKPRGEPVEPAEEVDPDAIADESFLTYVQFSGDFPFFSTVPDGKLTNLGRSLCADLDDGTDPYELAFQISDTLQVEETEAAALVGSAMGAYCPRHQSAW